MGGQKYGQLDFEGMTRYEKAVARVIAHPPRDGQPLYVAISGGKDSQALDEVVRESGVPAEFHYNMTGIDPPELVQFIRDKMPHVQMHRPPESIFKGVQKHGMPRRLGRWCCEHLKEYRGSGRTVVTGIRWAESARRKRRAMYEVCYNDSTKMYLSPIIDWTTAEVWEFLRLRGIEYCSLYDEGASGPYMGDGHFRRLGCVLCPMTTHRITMLEAARWPKIAQAWKNAAYRYFEKGVPSTRRWETAEDFWQWWLGRGEEPRVSDAQCVMFE